MTPGGVRVWDPVVRLLHWSLAALVITNFVLDDGGRLHRLIGYWAAGVIAARLLWALLARGRAGLAELRPSISRTLAYLRERAPRPLGHDPLGVWMVWLLWALVLGLAASGWASRLDMFWGDERVEAVHGFLAVTLQVCVLLHVGAVLAMSLYWRVNLPGSMVTGRKPATTDPRPHSNQRSDSTSGTSLFPSE